MTTIDDQIAELERIAAKAAGSMADAAVREAQQITLEDFLTPAQVRECMKLAGLTLMFGAPRRTGKALEGGELTNAIEEQVIKPNMAEINRKLSELRVSRGLDAQENDSRFLAYAVTYVMGEVSRRAR